MHAHRSPLRPPPAVAPLPPATHSTCSTAEARAQTPLFLCERNGAGIWLRFSESLLAVSRFGGWLFGSRGRCGSLWTPEVRIGLDPLIPRVAHARIEHEEVRLTLLN